MAATCCYTAKPEATLLHYIAMFACSKKDQKCTKTSSVAIINNESAVQWKTGYQYHLPVILYTIHLMAHLGHFFDLNLIDVAAALLWRFQDAKQIFHCTNKGMPVLGP